MELASTNGIDQRWTASGSRTDREVDPFPYAEPHQVGIIEPTAAARQQTERELRKRGLGGGYSQDGVIFVDPAVWRR
jgi:hypothetical protein